MDRERVLKYAERVQNANHSLDDAVRAHIESGTKVEDLRRELEIAKNELYKLLGIK